MSDQDRVAAAKARRSMLLWMGLLLLFALTGTLLAVGFVNRQSDDLLQQWQIRLGLVADSRAADVETWLDAQVAVLRQLAQNPSLQLYVDGLSAQAGGSRTEAAEATYLRNLLTATAQQYGFLASRPRQQLPASVPAGGTAGLALLDADGRMLVATTGMPTLSPEMQEAILRARQGEPRLADIHLGAQGLPVIGFVVPIFGLQGDAGVTPASGFVAGLREVDSDLFNKLVQPGEVSLQSETYLIRRSGDQVMYLSPLADGTLPLHRQLALATRDLADSFALAETGEFASKRDYRGHDVLLTSRQIVGSPWVLVHMIDRNVALGAASSRLGALLAGLILSILVGVALAFALWRNGTSVRLARAVAQNRGMLEDVRRSVDFLQRVTDAQPTQISTFDAVGRYTFANRSAALEAGADASAIIGKSLIDVMGPHKSKLFTDLNDRALVSGRVVSERHQLDDGTDRTVQSSHIPLPKEQGADRVLMVVQDITDLLREKQRSDRALGTLVDTLIAILDSLVPYWASHSRRVAELAHGIGLEMAVDRMQAAAAELAGRLLNVGVLLVRPEILLKPGKLTDAELAEVRQKVYATAALLKDVDFEAPVIETLQQSQEFWDGSGFPLGLKGEAILLPARIVALSRSFVSMTSSRAYRQALSPQDAYELLSRQADHQFDRRVVAALGNYLFNRGGLERAASYGKP